MNGESQVRSGDLRKPISIRIMPTGADSRLPNGEPRSKSPAATLDWGERCAPKAAVQFLKGIELTQSQRQTSELWVQFTIRYRTNAPIATDRVLWKGRTFDVISVAEPNAEDRVFDLMTIEVK